MKLSEADIETENFAGPIKVEALLVDLPSPPQPRFGLDFVVSAIPLQQTKLAS